MAHFAELDDNNKVIRVIVVNNSDILDSSGNESEEIGVQFCINLLGGRWVQTSYNRNFRKNFAGIGMNYNESKDAFIPDKPFPSWVFHEELGIWIPPVEKPISDESYIWNENVKNWEKYN